MKTKLQKVVTDLPKNKCEEDVISAALFTALEKEKGFGLSANQIGVDKRICVINIKEPMVLVNPKIVKRSEEAVQYIESCLLYTSPSPRDVEESRMPSSA